MDKKRTMEMCMRCSWLCAIPNGQRAKIFLCEMDPVYTVERKVQFVSLEKFETLECPPECTQK